MIRRTLHFSAALVHVEAADSDEEEVPSKFFPLALSVVDRMVVLMV